MKLWNGALLVLALGSLAYAQPPAVNAGGIVNCGSYATGGVAAGSIVCIFGTNLASQTASAGSIPLPPALGNVRSVTFNGVDAPLYFVSSNQINAQVPWNVLPAGGTSGTASVVVTTDAGASAPQSVQIVPALPGIFTMNQNGLGQAITTDNADGAIAAPAGSIPGINTHPISIGSYLIIWCTGLGPVDKPIANGANAGGQTANTLAKPAVLIGGVQASVVYSILSPQFVGEYQLAVQVPPGTPSGNAVALQIEVNGVTTAAQVTLAVAGPTSACPTPTPAIKGASTDGSQPYTFTAFFTTPELPIFADLVGNPIFTDCSASPTIWMVRP